MLLNFFLWKAPLIVLLDSMMKMERGSKNKSSLYTSAALLHEDIAEFTRHCTDTFVTEKFQFTMEEHSKTVPVTLGTRELTTLKRAGGSRKLKLFGFNFKVFFI